MKRVFFLVAAFLLGMCVWADEKVGALALAQNGDISIQNVGLDSVTPRTWIAIGSNSNFKVVCQVYYTDWNNPDPVENDEIREAESMDRFLNLGVEIFLNDRCATLSESELVEAYRSGRIREIVMNEIIGSIYTRMDELNQASGRTVVDADIHAVSMRAVGPFAKALAE